VTIKMYTNELDKRILPMKSPPITLYPHIANKLSVILSNEEALPWFYSNFIQVWTSKQGPNNYWADFLYFSGSRFCPHYKSNLISRKLMEYKWGSVIDFLIDAIDMGYYVYLNVDASVIPEYEEKKEEHWKHDVFVFGYDKKNKKLNIADFFKGFKYYYSEVSFNEFEKSYKNFLIMGEDDFINGIGVETYEKGIFKFDIDFIKRSINDYLSSSNTSISSDLSEFDNKDDIVYGIQVYEVFSDYISRYNKNEFKVADIRPFHMLLDHKNVMQLRLKYLDEMGYLENTDYFVNAYKKLQAEALIIRNMIIKHMIAKEDNSLGNVLKRISSISIDEKEVLRKLLYSIK
jgi:hypothetical protein